MRKVMLLIAVVIIMVMSGCVKEKKYNCQISERKNFYEKWIVVDEYEVDGNIVTLHKGSIEYEYDLEIFIIACSEMEVIE